MYKTIKYVQKRDGNYEDYNIARLQQSIIDIIGKVNEYNEKPEFINEVARKLSFIVSQTLSTNIKDDGIVHIDTIYDTVAFALFDIGYHNTGKNYLKYRYENIIAEKDKEIDMLRKELKKYTGGE